MTRRRADASSASIGWFGRPSSLQPRRFVGKTAVELRPDRIRRAHAGEVAKLSLTVTIDVAVADQRAPRPRRWRGRACVGLELGAAAVAHIERERRQQASRMITKLASATAIASQPVGSAVSDTAIVGSGMIETAPMAVK